MKNVVYLISICLLTLTSCATVRVSTDYDTQAQFNNYKTFAFFKPSVDKLEISDLDKKRILRAIEATMTTKGFQKSDTPDMLIALNTDAQKNVRSYQNNFGWGWGYGPFWNNGFTNTYVTTEGILHIDIVDNKNQSLIWRGTGSAPLVDGPEAKEARIKEIVSSILEKYPPGK